MRESDWKFVLELTSELGQLPREQGARWHHFVGRLQQRMEPYSVLFGDAAQNARVVEPILFGVDEKVHAGLLDELPDLSRWTPVGFELNRRSHTGAAILERERAATNSALAKKSGVVTRRLFGLSRVVCASFAAPAPMRPNFCFIRDPKSPAFTRREAEILHLATQYGGPLLLDCKPARSVMERLAPRLRGVAERLLLGDSAKQAARHLGLSVHTVTQYTKLLHRELRVSSRAELMLALLEGREEARRPLTFTPVGPGKDFIGLSELKARAARERRTLK